MLSAASWPYAVLRTQQKGSLRTSFTLATRIGFHTLTAIFLARKGHWRSANTRHLGQNINSDTVITQFIFGTYRSGWQVPLVSGGKCGSATQADGSDVTTTDKGRHSGWQAKAMLPEGPQQMHHVPPQPTMPPNLQTFLPESLAILLLSEMSCNFK